MLQLLYNYDECTKVQNIVTLNNVAICIMPGVQPQALTIAQPSIYTHACTYTSDEI